MIIYPFIGPITDDQVDIFRVLEKVISHHIYDHFELNEKFMFWTVLSAYREYRNKYYCIRHTRHSCTAKTFTVHAVSK